MEHLKSSLLVINAFFSILYTKFFFYQFLFNNNKKTIRICSAYKLMYQAELHVLWDLVFLSTMMEKYLWIYINRWVCYIKGHRDKSIHQDMVLCVTIQCGHIFSLSNTTTMPSLQWAQDSEPLVLTQLFPPLRHKFWLSHLESVYFIHKTTYKSSMEEKD